MPDAPLGPEQWLQITRAVALGSVGTLGLFMLAGLAVYAFLCWRSSRQWDGMDRRWAVRRP